MNNEQATLKPKCKIKLVVVLSALLIGLGFIAYKSSNFLEVDKCMDSGGCWDSKNV